LEIPQSLEFRSKFKIPLKKPCFSRIREYFLLKKQNNPENLKNIYFFNGISLLLRRSTVQCSDHSYGRQHSRVKNKIISALKIKPIGGRCVREKDESQALNEDSSSN